MGINKELPHLLILPEDDAYRDLANGFVNYDAVADNRIHIAKPAGGWLKLLDVFSQEYESSVRDNRSRHVLLLLDLDGRCGRYSEKVLPKIPEEIRDRVFILSCNDEAENFKKELGGGKFEDFGEKLSKSCRENAYTKSDWLCPQLCHNKNELHRLATAVRSFLFKI